MHCFEFYFLKGDGIQDNENSFEQEPRLLNVLGFVSSESEFDLVLGINVS